MLVVLKSHRDSLGGALSLALLNAFRVPLVWQCRTERQTVRDRLNRCCQHSPGEGIKGDSLNPRLVAATSHRPVDGATEPPNAFLIGASIQVLERAIMVASPGGVGSAMSNTSFVAGTGLGIDCSLFAEELVSVSERESI